MTSPRVFISHSSCDADRAMELCAFLESHDVKCWIAPRDIRPGTAYPNEIMRGIEECPVFLLIISDESVRSQHVNTETDIAFNSNKQIIPFFINDVKLKGSMHYYLARKQWVLGYEDYAVAKDSLLNSLVQNQDGPHNRNRAEEGGNISGGADDSKFRSGNILSSDSKDVTLAFERNGWLYFSLAQTGKKFKIDLRSYKDDDLIISAIENVRMPSVNAANVSASDIPSENYIRGHLSDIDNDDTRIIYFICQPNMDSISRAYRMKALIKSRPVRIYLAPNLNAFFEYAKERKYSEEAERVRRFGNWCIGSSEGDGVFEVISMIKSDNWDKCVTSFDFIRGLILNHFISVYKRKLDLLLLDMVGFDISVRYKERTILKIEKDTKFPTRTIENMELQKGETLKVYLQDMIISEIKLTSDFDFICIVLDAFRNITIELKNDGAVYKKTVEYEI